MLTYQIIRSRRRTVSLIIHRDGQVVVRAPLRLAERAIHDFVESKAGWIEKKQVELARQAEPRKTFAEGELFYYLGKTYPLSISATQRALLTFSDRFTLAESALPRAAQVFERWYKARASDVIGARVAELAQAHGLAYQKIRISSARTRWGSCSTRGTLSFSWRLVMAPPGVIDYVIIHELAHLKQHNHSAAFWALVQALMPDYSSRRDWLKKNGRILSLD